ncbi:hypothetical protein ACRAWD_30910 [Caulobacter segnis]
MAVAREPRPRRASVRDLLFNMIGLPVLLVAAVPRPWSSPPR